MQQGPHCPKCGNHDQWESYANGDALQCRAFCLTKATQGTVECNYIHWLRNEPKGLRMDDSKPTYTPGMPPGVSDYTLRKRKRVTELVHSILASPASVYIVQDQPFTPVASLNPAELLVAYASRLDDAIMLIEAPKDGS